jgi:hypothetical protein
MRKAPVLAAAAALTLGLLATAPIVLASHGADDGATRQGIDDSASRQGTDDNPSRGGGGGGGGDRSDVRVAGTCTHSSRAKLKLGREDGRVEVEFEVDQNRVGKRWGVVLKRNGVRVLSRTATTRAPSGSFEVRALIAPGSPHTKVTAVARRAVKGGEVCRAVATLA